MRVKKLTEQEIIQIVTTVVQTYQMFDNDVIDLMNASGLSEIKSREIVRKRYKDFMIN